MGHYLANHPQRGLPPDRPLAFTVNKRAYLANENFSIWCQNVERLEFTRDCEKSLKSLSNFGIDIKFWNFMGVDGKVKR